MGKLPSPYKGRRRLRLRMVVIGAVAVALTVMAGVQATPSKAKPGETVVVSCPFNPAASGGDRTDRGFYVTGYPGPNLGTVTLRYSANVPGTYTVVLTARLGTYDGPLVGTPQIAVVSVPATGTSVPVTFDFGFAPVAPGSTITFTQTFVGPGQLFYNVGTGGLDDMTFNGCPGVIETEGTNPPLDDFRRGSVGVIITACQDPKDKPGSDKDKCRDKP
jgi:hypothetical protein